MRKEKRDKLVGTRIAREETLYENYPDLSPKKLKQFGDVKGMSMD